jgi:dTDP-4-amino-4,6-dideoxygalactose transaminase
LRWDSGISSWPQISEEVVVAVAAVPESGKAYYWTTEHGVAFESECAKHCGVSCVVSLANGTVALELALRVLGTCPEDDVIVTLRAFFALASAIVMVGVNPVISDIDPDSQNITASLVEGVITE